METTTQPYVRTTAQAVEQFGKIPVMVLFGTVAVFAVGFTNLLDVQVGKDKVGLDAQVLVKLLCSGLLGIYGFCGLYMLPKVRAVLSSFPGFALIGIGVLYLLVVPFSITPTYAMASALVLNLVIVGTITACVHLGTRNTLVTLFMALALYNIGSWLAYFLIPSIGVFEEPTVEGRFTIRMGGLAHPNTLGQLSAMTIILGATLYSCRWLRSWFVPLIILSAVATLYMSYSRTSLLATMGGLVMAYRGLFFRKDLFVYYLVIIALVISSVLFLFAVTDLGQTIESRLSLLTKSGDTSELKTATGRAEIWSYAFKLIQERPLYGYGAASSKVLLADYSMYTHNLWLNVMLSTGVLGGLLILLVTLGRLKEMLAKGHPVADGLLAMILINGLFENVIFSLLAGIPTMLFVIVLTWWHPAIRPDTPPTAIAQE